MLETLKQLLLSELDHSPDPHCLIKVTSEGFEQVWANEAHNQFVRIKATSKLSYAASHEIESTCKSTERRLFAVDYIMANQLKRCDIVHTPWCNDTSGKVEFVLCKACNVSVRDREGDALLQIIAEGADLGTWTLEVKTGQTRWNDRWWSIIGYGTENRPVLNEQGFHQLVHPDDLTILVEQYLGHLAGTRPQLNSEFRMRHRDGRWVWIQSRGRVVRWAQDGSPLLMCGTHLDITEEKHARLALEEKNRQLDLLAANVPGCLQTIRIRDGQSLDYTYIGPHAEATFGIPIDKITPAEIRSRVPNDDCVRLDAARRVTRATGLPLDIDVNYMRPDGSLRSLRLRSNMGVEDNGDEIWNGIWFDNTDRNLALRDLQVQNERMEMLAENLPGALHRVRIRNGVGWSYEFIGKKAEQIFGLPVAELTPQITRDMMHPGHHDRLLAARDVALETLGSYETQISITRPDAEERHLRILANFHSYDFSQNPDGDQIWDSIWLDTTEAHRAHINLQSAYDLLEMERARAESERMRAEDASRSKTVFLSTMSHEIRTPLTAVLGFSELLAASNLGEQDKAHVEIIRKTGAALLRIINDVLDLSKMEAGQLKIDLAPYSIPVLVNDILATAKLLGSERGLELAAEISSDLPAWAMGGAGHINQIVTNLINNAVKFTENGSVKLNVSRVTIEGRDHIRWSVKDTGIGIPARDIPRLFRMFEQVEQSITRHYGGTGLGLSIVKRLAEAMGGSVGVSSEAGVGSQFWCDLPLIPADASVSERQPKPEGQLRQPLPAGKVLVVDDAELNATLFEALLQREGQEVVIAVDGVDAVRKASEHQFDLIFMDVHMPRMNGLDATRAIKAQPGLNRDTPIIAITAAVLESETAACFASGMTGHMAKPVDTDLLRQVLSRHIVQDRRLHASV